MVGPWANPRSVQPPRASVAHMPYSAISSWRGGSGSKATLASLKRLAIVHTHDGLDGAPVGLESDFDGVAARAVHAKTIGEHVVIPSADGADIEIVPRACAGQLDIIVACGDGSERKGPIGTNLAQPARLPVDPRAIGQHHKQPLRDVAAGCDYFLQATPLAAGVPKEILPKVKARHKVWR